jgi:hypothetical protein
VATLALEMPRSPRALTENQFDSGSEYPETSSAALTRVPKAFVISTREKFNRFVVTTSELPGWVEPTISAISSIQLLGENWDSYGGKKTSDDLIKLALSILTQIMPVNAPVPSVVPLGDGGLQLEWHRKQQDLEIVFPADTTPTFYYCKKNSGVETEGFATDFLKLATFVGSIS